MFHVKPRLTWDMGTMATYIRWQRIPRQGFIAAHWVGRAATGKELFHIEQRKSASASRQQNTRVAYLIRVSGTGFSTAERCSTVQVAKDYADNLARLWNFAPLECEAA